MTKVFISQPMNGRDNEAILSERNRIADACHLKWNDCEIVPSYFADEKDEKSPVYLLGEAIEKMSEADVAAFAPEWYRARGCRVEHHIAQAYFDSKDVFASELNKYGTMDIYCEESRRASGAELAEVIDAYFVEQGNIMRFSDSIDQEMGRALAKAKFLALEEKLKKAGITPEEAEEYVGRAEQYRAEKKNNK